MVIPLAWIVGYKKTGCPSPLMLIITVLSSIVKQRNYVINLKLYLIKLHVSLLESPQYAYRAIGST